MFFTRLLSSVVLVVIALVTLLGGGYLLAAVLLFISFVAYHELSKACGIHADGQKVNILEATGMAGIAAYYGLVAFTDSQEAQMLAVLLTMIALMVVYVFTFPKYQSFQVMTAFFSFVYGPVMFSFIYKTRELRYGIYLVWMIFISSWVCDSCAYLTGILIGRHKLTPKLSPKKSVEGAIGGVAGSVLIGAVYGYFIVERLVPEQEITWVFAVISGAGAVISQIGDLAASAIKRNHNIKDYGHLIPGHGGIMDRFDSVIFTAPMIYGLALLLMK
ncbi:MAG TPA: phosphatidate cytidylyltransferase [Lachnospiraceae bacterium]|nr:phosphatidate cytidylyltransferase [Lachnospiraceae bacterium]